MALTIYLIAYVIEANSFPIELLYVMGLTPFLYFISFILYKILSRVALCRTCCSRLKEKIKARKENQHLHIPSNDNIDEDLPDRIVNPDMYQPLLAATNNGEENESQPQAGVNSLAAYGSM